MCCGAQRAVAAQIPRRRRPPRRAPARELLVGHAQREPPRRHVELDDVAVLHERERAADVATRARRAARTPRSSCRSCARPRCAPCRARPRRAASSESAAGPTPACPGAPIGPACLSTSTESRRHRQVGIVDARGHVVVVGKHDGRAGVAMQPRLGGRRLDDGAVGREIAAQHRERVAARRARSRGVRMTSSLKTLRAGDVLAERSPVDRECARRRSGRRDCSAARAARRRRRSPPSGTRPTAGCWRGAASAARAHRSRRGRARRPRGAPSRSGG